MTGIYDVYIYTVWEMLKTTAVIGNAAINIRTRSVASSCIAGKNKRCQISAVQRSMGLSLCAEFCICDSSLKYSRNTKDGYSIEIISEPWVSAFYCFFNLSFTIYSDS